MPANPNAAGMFMTELQDFLQKKLPRHMVPSTFVVLDKLPLTANGKVDRKALSQQHSLRTQPKQARVEPQTDLERKVVALWQEVLGTQHIGLNDNFFDLGANSLHIVQMHNKLRVIFKREVPLVEMFKNPTVNFLAEYLRDQHEEQPSFEKIDDRAQKQKIAIARQQQAMRALRNDRPKDAAE
jgi:acyl carrier protein